MKKSVIAAGALVLLASTGAKAADIVTVQEQIIVAVPAAVNWNGAYIGGTIGGSWAESKTRLKVNGKSAVKKSVDPDSFIGGIYAGYNFQPGFLSGTGFLKDVVFGIETDFLFNSGDSNGKKDFEYRTPDKLYRNIYKASVKQKWNGATRLRAGYALGSEGRLLPYLAGGVSYADIQLRGSAKGGEINNASTANFPADGDRASKTKTRAGWNIGAGMDYVPPFLNDHLILRAEYRFTDFGKETYGRSTSMADGSVYKEAQRAKFRQNDFRVGVAYKF